MNATTPTLSDLKDALCSKNIYQTSEYSWFPELENFIEEENARSVCNKCPIKFSCAQVALESREVWGVWGGMHPFKMRRALGVDEFGENRILSRDLVCPFCDSVDLIKAKKKNTKGYSVECNDCGIVWNSFRIPDKVRKTLRRTYDGNMARSVEHARDEG